MRSFYQIYFEKSDGTSCLPPHILRAEIPDKAGEYIVIATHTPAKERGGKDRIQFITSLAPLVAEFVDFCYGDDFEGKKTINEDNKPFNRDVGLEFSELFIKYEDNYFRPTIKRVFVGDEVTLLERVLRGEEVAEYYVDFTKPCGPKDVISVHPASVLITPAGIEGKIKPSYGIVRGGGKKRRSNFLSEAAEKTFG